MLALLIALLAPPGLAPSAQQTRCLDAGHAPSCDRWLSPLRRGTPDTHLRRACAFEAPFSCGLLADRRPAWATADQRIGWRLIACRADAVACVKLVDEMGDVGVSKPVRLTAKRAVEGAARRWPEVWYAIAREATDPASLTRALTQGCAGKDARACRDLAWRLERGDGMPAHPKKARAAGDRACRLGDAALCLHRLRQRQDAKDWAGIARACRRGDALSCDAQDARSCLRGDPEACLRVAAVPPGACRPVRQICPRIPYLPPGDGGGPGAAVPWWRCPMIDGCEGSRQKLRTHAWRWLVKAAEECAVSTARLRLQVSRSGDLYAIATNANRCLTDRLTTMRLPASEAPVTIRARVIALNGRRRVVVKVR